jgi:hypothetical protein
MGVPSIARLDLFFGSIEQDFRYLYNDRYRKITILQEDVNYFILNF